MNAIPKCPYEEAVRNARTGFLVLAGLAIAAPMFAAAICYFVGAPSMWLARAGAVMAGLSYLADLRARAMLDVFKDDSFVDDSFWNARAKYSAQISACSRIAVGLALIGTAVWGFGDLLPISGQPQLL